MHSTRDNSASSQPASRKPGTHNAPIQFAGSTLGTRCHVCAFFGTPEEEYRVLLPFIKKGFERGERAFHIVDPKLRNRDPVICTYSKRSAAFIIDIMRAHPMIIIGGILQENPFYVQPEEFVRKLRAREASSQGPAGASA
jgi:hypothetical protein